MSPQKEKTEKADTKQFAAIWLLNEDKFEYQPHGKTEDDPVLDTANPFSPNPTEEGQTYIVARPELIEKAKYATHSEKFIWLEVSTFSIKFAIS